MTFEQAWDSGLFLGQSTSCVHCGRLIWVIDANACDTQLHTPELMWQHLSGYFACGNPGTQPQAEPKQ